MLCLTDTQYDRLPELLKAIVDMDRLPELDRGAKVRPIQLHHVAIELRTRRADLTRQAAERWGGSASGAGPQFA